MPLLLAACLSGCGFGRIKTENVPQQGPAEKCEAHFVSFFRSYSEIGGNACSATLAASGAKVDASLAQAVANLATLAAKLAP